MLKIIQAPNQVLSQEAKSIGKIDKSIRELLKKMEETLVGATDPEGVGLAAPQIGKSLQLFIIKQSPRSPVLTFINPVIESFFDASKEKQPEKPQEGEHSNERKGVQLEGCLSVYNVWGVVKRSHGVVLSYQDAQGEKHHRKFDGFLATIIQHEVDHLHGTLFPKRVIEQNNKLYRSVKNKKGEVEFEELEI